LINILIISVFSTYPDKAGVHGVTLLTGLFPKVRQFFGIGCSKDAADLALLNVEHHRRLNSAVAQKTIPGSRLISVNIGSRPWTSGFPAIPRKKRATLSAPEIKNERCSANVVAWKSRPCLAAIPFS
jgi:hypothetical protein